MSPGAGESDSAGVPWSGRTLTPQPFAGDDGTADPALTTALADGDLHAIVVAWAPTRVLVPIVAVLGEGSEVVAATEAGHGDKSADMALVTATLADGRRALPVFSSISALSGWNAQARPVPVKAARAAQSAVVENCDVIVIDPAGTHSRVLPRPAVWAVAQGREWVPPAADMDLLAGIAALTRAVPQIRKHRCEPYGDAGLTVILGLPPGLAVHQVQETTSRISEMLASDPVVTERTDSIRISVRAV